MHGFQRRPTGRPERMAIRISDPVACGYKRLPGQWIPHDGREEQ